jgi:hypothetical protein
VPSRKSSSGWLMEYVALGEVEQGSCQSPRQQCQAEVSGLGLSEGLVGIISLVAGSFFFVRLATSQEVPVDYWKDWGSYKTSCWHRAVGTESFSREYGS